MTYHELTATLAKCGASYSESIPTSARLKEDLQMTSFSMMLLLMELETKLSKSLSPTDFLPVRTVADLCGVLGIEHSMD